MLLEVNNISFNIKPYQVYGIVELDGESRHQLFKSLIEPETYHSGRITYNGESLRSAYKAGEVVLIEATPFFFKRKTVLDQLRIHMRYLGLYQSEAIDSVLNLVELEDKKEMLIEDLSLKDRKKLALARGLLSKPSLLIIDDLLDGLDGDTKKMLMRILWQLKRDQQTAMLFSSQDIKLLESFSDIIACLKGGQLVSELTVEMLDNINRAYLEVKTPQLKEASMVLHDQLQIEAFKIIEPDKIQIFEWTIDTNTLLKTFIERDVLIKGFSIEKQTISDYYYNQMEVV